MATLSLTVWGFGLRKVLETSMASGGVFGGWVGEGQIPATCLPGISLALRQVRWNSLESHCNCHPCFLESPPSLNGPAMENV